METLEVFLARDIANMRIDEVWDLPDDDITLIFDDGSIDTSMRETWYSRYGWEIHRQYPETPLLMEHHVHNTRVTPTTHLTLMGRAAFACFKRYKELGRPVNKEDVSQLIYLAFNGLYNDTIVKLPEYVGTVSVLDFIAVAEQEEVVAANKTLFDKSYVSSVDIEDAYKIIEKTIMNKPVLEDNNLVSALRSKVVKMDQILQCVGPRGFVADADGWMYPRPILSGYLGGHMRIADSLKDSRSAVTAMYNQKDPMRQSETFNRMLQFSSGYVSRLHQHYDHGLIDKLSQLLSSVSMYDYKSMVEDCGSTDYIPFAIRDSKTLDNALGVNFWNEDTQALETITSDRRDLIGRILKVRLAPSCKVADRGGFCITCMGDVGLGVPLGTNIGHASCTTMQEKATQGLLSTKHHMQSMVADKFTIRQGDRAYISTDGKNTIFVSERLKNKQYSIYIPEVAATGLHDLLYINESEIEPLSPSRVSELEFIQFAVHNEDDSVNLADIEVAITSRLSSLSKEMLLYIKHVGWSIDDLGNYVIDMKHWDVKKPFLVLPLKQFSMIDYVLSIKKCFQGGAAGRGTPTLRSYPNMAEAINGLYDLVSLKLQVNLSHLAVIALTLSVEDVENRDFRLPLDKLNGTIVSYKEAIKFRSYSAILAYQHQFETIFSPSAPLVRNRPAHPLDPLLFG